MYTLNRELMEPKAEIRVGEKVYLVDDRTSVVKKVMALTRNNQQDTEQQMEQILKMVLGQKAYQEIEEMDLPFAAYLQLFEMTVDAITGGKEENRFPQ